MAALCKNQVVIIAVITSRKRLSLFAGKGAPTKREESALSLKVNWAVHYVSERHVLSDSRNLDGHSFIERSVTHADDEPTFDSRNTVALVANTFNFDSPPFTHFNRRARMSGATT